MPSQDPSLLLLYECVKTVGAKKIDWNKVGEALGVNGTAARMRFTRLEFKMENGTIRSRTASFPRATPQKSQVKPKPKKLPQAARKRDKRADSESESAVSSQEDVNQSESEDEIKVEGKKGQFRRQTRGIKLDLKDAFDSFDDKSESSSDDYDETAEKEDNSDDDMSGIEQSPVAHSSVKESGITRPFRRSDSPPTTPGRLVRSEQPTLSPLTSSSSLESLTETVLARSMSELSRDQQIKRDISKFTDGMMVSVNHLPSSPNTSRKISTGSIPSVDESAVLQSIEHDEEECEGLESADEEMGEGGEDEGDDGEDDDNEEEGEPFTPKGLMGPSAVPVKSSYFQWMRSAVNRS